MVARLSCSFLSKTIDEIRFMERKSPCPSMKKDMGLGFVVGDRLDLHSLDGAKRGSDRLHFTCTGLVIPVDAFELDRQIAQQVESIVEPVTNEHGHIDGFFHGRFLAV